jgi:hypothetical protein
MNARRAGWYCRCGRRLGRDRRGQLCGVCEKKVAALRVGPADVPAGFWDTEQFRDAFAAQHIGQVSRAYRKHPHHVEVYGKDGIPQEVVGGWLGLTQAQVSRIENGPPVRHLDSLAHWARTLRIPPPLLWFKLPPGTAADHDEDGRVLLASGCDEQLGYALAHPGGVDLVVVAGLRERIHALDVRYDRAPSTSLVAEAGQCLGQVVFLRAHAAASRVRRELSVAEAEAATLMGQLVWDASQRRDHATARVYFDQAVGAAQQVGDRIAEGRALLRTCFVALYGEHDPKTGLRLALQTAETTKNDSHVLTGLAILHAAEAYAMRCQSQDCTRALGQAAWHFGQIGTADPAIDLFSPTQHGRLAGSCHLFLQDAPRAQLILEPTAQALQDRSKPQAIVLGNLALAYIRQRKLDEATAALHQAIDVVEVTWGGGGLTIVFGAGRELRPWRQVPVVQEVYDRLFTLIAAA